MSEPQDTNEAAGGRSDSTAVLERDFTFEIEEVCSACDFHGADDECEVCGGEIEYKRTVTVPLDVCIEIHKHIESETRLMKETDQLLSEVRGFLRSNGQGEPGRTGQSGADGT